MGFGHLRRIVSGDAWVRESIVNVDVDISQMDRVRKGSSDLTYPQHTTSNTHSVAATSLHNIASALPSLNHLNTLTLANETNHPD